ncbi:MAG: hypothetical protein UW19_C0031G0001 [Candidatus Moranbacteria bacterium GW2011_GWF2_44_10]|nr:MAG: hypothetical protein UW19_C0031G0001 [Candidatus Moranbacteria bacterium GW2011_GWF2_44_10]
MPYRKFIISSCIMLTSLIAKSAFAVCPVCTVAVGAGLGLAQWFGIDDSISGLWIGALVVSVSIWTINWLNGKNLRFKGRKILIFLGYYAIVILPLWKKGLIGHPYNKLCGIDKLLFGIIFGTILFTAGVLFHNYIRKKNGDVSYFKGQKIVFAVAPIIIASIILYFTC